MSDSTRAKDAHDFAREATRFLRQTADVAAHVAATEERVANTLEQVAEHRPPHDAERLRARAQEAREYAAKVRGLSEEYATRWGSAGGGDHAGEPGEGDEEPAMPTAGT